MTYKLNQPTNCPECDGELDAATCVNSEGNKPNAGDFSVCFHCAQILVFDENGSYRVPNKEEEAVISTIPELLDAQRAVRQSDRTGNEKKKDKLYEKAKEEVDSMDERTDRIMPKLMIRLADICESESLHDNTSMLYVASQLFSRVLALSLAFDTISGEQAEGLIKSIIGDAKRNAANVRKAKNAA